VVDREQCAKTVEEVKGWLLQSCNIAMDDVSTWDKWPLTQHGFGECYALPTMWTNRENPNIYNFFSTLLQEPNLWVSVDRVGCKRPGVIYDGDRAIPKREWHRDAFVHTDCNLWHPPQTLQIQGVLALEDTADDQGGFACIPDFHKEYREWRKSVRPEWVGRAHPKKVFNIFPDTQMIQERLTTIVNNAGDLVVWNSLLPHCNTRNLSDKWRYCQYIRMYPVCEENAHLINDSRDCYMTGARPKFSSTGGTTSQENADIEKRGHKRVQLTPLGRKLVGVDTWEE